jgi:hypothetical protein
LYQQIFGLVKQCQVKQVTLQGESGEVEVELKVPRIGVGMSAVPATDAGSGLRKAALAASGAGLEPFSIIA